ncbi:hypothetical protein EV182_001534 [Spiromyces aspiralis]|uniref:Uncharacterized protein n=1 Tax=Spiromyces aspiralis TaxID=68401 RepID=A0ACC1HH02_9FUNG|nr:hypothetical protein EV182_001534 [Spiromyces aspiralis]
MEVMPTTIPSSMVFTSSENCCPSTAVPRYSFHPGWMMGSVSVINHQTWPSSPLPQRFRRQQQRLLRNSIPGNNNNNHVLLSSSHLFEASGSRLHSASLRAFSTTQFPLAASGSSGEGNHQQQPSGLSQSEAMDNFDEASFWSYFACDDAATAAYSSPSMSNISVVAEDYHMGTAEHESLNRSFLDAIPFHTNSDYSSVSPDSSSLLGSTTTTNTTVFSEDIAAGSEEIWYERYQAREAMKAAANSLENRIVPTGGHSKATKGRIIEVVDNE